MYVSLSEVPDQERRAMERALTCMYNQLSAVEKYRTSCRQFSGNLTVIANRKLAPGNTAGLSQVTLVFYMVCPILITYLLET